MFYKTEEFLSNNITVSMRFQENVILCVHQGIHIQRNTTVLIKKNHKKSANIANFILETAAYQSIVQKLFWKKK